MLGPSIERIWQDNEAGHRTPSWVGSSRRTCSWRSVATIDLVRDPFNRIYNSSQKVETTLIKEHLIIET